jgi:succinate dehydrogenase/fumarate reductase flavoprotein subunit
MPNATPSAVSNAAANRNSYSGDRTVVVIGQGAAGLTAALAAAQQGVKVISISKVRPGGATCTIYAGGGFTLGVEGMSTDEHRRMTYETGRHMNVPELLDAFSREAPSIVDFLRAAGVPFAVTRGRIGLRRDPAFPLLGGKALIDGLHEACVDLGVTFVPNMVAMRLLASRDGIDGIGGVECVDHSSGQVVTFEGDAVLLATGGGGALYERTDNPQRVTGDGYRLALDASCRLMDMEFVQFYPMGFDMPGGGHWFIDLGVVDRARVTSVDGREFLKEMLRKEGISSGWEANLLARDKCSVAIALENEKGQCLLHLEDIPEEQWRKSGGSFIRMFPASSPPWSGPVPLHPIEHYFPGGVVIGTDGQTEVPCLFACGEVTGGVDGANRVGGNALTNCVLFGMKAGRSAARHARGEDVGTVGALGATTAQELPAVELPALKMPALQLPPVRPAREWLDMWRSNAAAVARTGVAAAAADPDREGPVSPADLRSRLKAFSSRYLLPLRRGHLLEQAQGDIDGLRCFLERQSVKDSRDLLLATENLSLWYTAAVVARGALVRRESRGAHYRDDLPSEDPAWVRHVYMSSQGDRLASEVI